MAKQSYRVTNWKEYNQALVNRGSLALWIDKRSVDGWLANDKPKRQGRRKTYSDEAIYSIMCVKAVFRLPYRALEGMVRSLAQLADLALPVPSFQQIQRRAKTLRLSKKVSKKQPTDIVMDASGIKIYGEGEWQQERRKQRGKKQWKKIHVAIDPDTGEIVMEDITDSDCHDSTMLPSLLEGCPKRVRNVYADGAYDTQRCYAALHDRGITPYIPPRMGAITREGEHLRTRNSAIGQIVALGGDAEAMTLWKKLTGYGRRSLVETAFSRFKRSFGERAWSRGGQSFAVEINLKWRILNRFSQLGRCKSYAF